MTVMMVPKRESAEVLKDISTKTQDITTYTDWPLYWVHLASKRLDPILPSELP